jgi:hypothetical protein
MLIGSALLNARCTGSRRNIDRCGGAIDIVALETKEVKNKEQWALHSYIPNCSAYPLKAYLERQPGVFAAVPSTTEME